MQIILAQTLVLLSVLLAFGYPTNATPPMRLNSYVELPDQSASGFLKFTGQCQSTTFYALSKDIGSAVPSEDLRLYAQTGDNFRLIFSLPMTHRKGFRCQRDSDTLTVYVIDNYKDLVKTGTGRHLLSIDLAALLETVSPSERLNPTPGSQQMIPSQQLLHRLATRQQAL